MFPFKTVSEESAIINMIKYTMHIIAALKTVITITCHCGSYRGCPRPRPRSRFSMYPDRRRAILDNIADRFPNRPGNLAMINTSSCYYLFVLVFSDRLYYQIPNSYVCGATRRNPTVQTAQGRLIYRLVLVVSDMQL